MSELNNPEPAEQPAGPANGNGHLIPAEVPQPLSPIDPFDGHVKYWMTWKDDEPGGALRVMNCFGGGAVPIEKMIGKTVPIVGCLTHPVPITQKDTGEIVERMRTVHIGEDGTVYACVSIGVFNQTCRLASLIKHERLVWPVLVEYQQEPCGQAGRVFTFRVVSDGSKPPAKQGGGKRGN